MADKYLPFEEAGVAPIIGTPYRVNSIMADRVNRLIGAAPEDLQGELRHAITSGYRDWEQQTKAYLHYLSGGGLAAKPGASWHERFHGMAVDWNHATPRAWTYLKANGPGFGIAFPLGPRDPYHSQAIETVGAGSLMARRAVGPAAPMREALASPPPATPEVITPQANSTPYIAPVPNRDPTTIITPPSPAIQAPAYHPLQLRMPRVPAGHLGSMAETNLAGSLRGALASILRRR